MGMALVRGGVAAALMMTVVAQAEAQGGLLRKAKDAAARRVAGEATESVAEKAAPTAAARGRGPTFTDDVLEITDARLTALLRGLDAESELRPTVEREHAAQMARYQEAVAAYPAQVERYDRAYDAWQKKDAARAKCVDDLTAKWEREDANDPDLKRAQAVGEDFQNDEAAQEALQKRMEDIGARMQAANARGDTKTMMALNDSLQLAMRPLTQAGNAGAAAASRIEGRMEGRKKEALTKCGAQTKSPESPKSPNDYYPKDAAQRLDRAGAKAASLTERQYAVLRERVEAYVLLRKRNSTRSLYVFSDGERSVLEARAGELGGRSEFGG